MKTIFILGCPRSGTTLVGNLLGSHTQAYWANESGFFYFLNVVWLPSLVKQPSPLTPIFSREVNLFARGLVYREVEKAGKTIFVDDTPGHVFCLEQLVELFPQSYFVHVIRDGRAVVSSLKRSYEGGYKWAGGSLQDRVVIWKKHIEAALVMRDSEKYSEVKYEELLADPRRITKQLCGFTEMVYDEEMLRAFTTLHAGSTSKRAPIGYENSIGKVCFHDTRSFSYDQGDWDEESLETYYRIAGALHIQLGYGT